MTDKSIFDLTGKTALVTGASRGLGRAFAKAMAMFGADVACAGRDMDKLGETVGGAISCGRRVAAVPVDVTDEESVKNMVAATTREFGRIDIFFNNAGMTTPLYRVDETPVSEWDKVIGTNLRGSFMCLKYVIKAMLPAKKGSIINISSIAGLRAEIPEMGPAAYGASKAAIINLTQVAAMEYAKDGIRVNCIAPGAHNTELGHNPGDPPLDAEALRERQKFLGEYCAAEVPMGRFGEPGELAGLAVLLASDASSYITGQVFVQDGGQSARL